MGTYGEYRTLIERCARWSVPDLADLLHEIERDRQLGPRDRAELQADVYRLIWDRTSPDLPMRPSDAHSAA